MAADFGGEWGFDTASPRVIFGTIIPRLHQFERMTWQKLTEVRSTHSMPIESISPVAQRRLTEIERDDIEKLFQLNIGGKKRLWGVKDRNIFHLLWWDPEHTVYPVNKKHT